MQEISIASLSAIHFNEDSAFSPVSVSVSPDVVLTPKRVSRASQLKKFKLPIPEEAKIFRIPSDINKYLTLIYPNMVCMLSVKIGDKNVVHQVLSDFICYMLDKSQKGVPRYRLYNPVKYPNQPYYKWMVVQINYFYLDHLEAIRNYQKHNVSLVENLSDDEEFVPNTISMNSLVKGVENSDPFNTVSSNYISDYIKEMSDSYNAYEKKPCFECYAYDLFKAKLLKTSNADFAKQIGVSVSAVTSWFKKLKELIRDLYEGNEQEFWTFDPKF